MPRPGADASVFHAIADRSRRAVLEMLADEELSVGQMLERVRRGNARATQPGLSQHLAVLRRAGLVTARRRGRHQMYRVRPRPLREVADWVAYFDRFWTDRLGALGRYLDREGNKKGVRR